MQPTNKKHIPSPKISGGANDIYIKGEAPRTAGGANNIYMSNPAATAGGANDIYMPENPKVSGGANDIYLQSNQPTAKTGIYLKDNTPV